MLNNNHFEVAKSFTVQIIMIIKHLGTYRPCPTHKARWQETHVSHACRPFQMGRSAEMKRLRAPNIITNLSLDLYLFALSFASGVRCVPAGSYIQKCHFSIKLIIFFISLFATFLSFHGNRTDSNRNKIIE